VKASSLAVRRILKPAAILLIVAVGLIHLIGAPQHYKAAPYVGVGFVVNFIGALVAAVGLYRDVLWGWLLGVIVAGGALVMYVVSRSVGLPGFEHAVGRWSGPLGVLSVVVEALFITIFLLWLSARRG
jgi:hypothetical protein